MSPFLTRSKRSRQSSFATTSDGSVLGPSHSHSEKRSMSPHISPIVTHHQPMSAHRQPMPLVAAGSSAPMTTQREPMVTFNCGNTHAVTHELPMHHPFTNRTLGTCMGDCVGVTRVLSHVDWQLHAAEMKALASVGRLLRTNLPESSEQTTITMRKGIQEPHGHILEAYYDSPSLCRAS